MRKSIDDLQAVWRNFDSDIENVISQFLGKPFQCPLVEHLHFLISTTVKQYVIEGKFSFRVDNEKMEIWIIDAPYSIIPFIPLVENVRENRNYIVHTNYGVIGEGFYDMTESAYMSTFDPAYRTLQIGIAAYFTMSQEPVEDERYLWSQDALYRIREEPKVALKEEQGK